MSTENPGPEAGSGRKSFANVDSVSSIDTLLSRGAEFTSAEEAYACFEKAIDRGGETAVCYFGMGKAIGKGSRDLVDHEKAIEHFDRALELLEAAEQDRKEEFIADIQIQRAFSCAIARRFDDGFESVNLALEVYRASEDKKKIGHALCHEGILLYFSGQKNMALAKFDEALRVNPADGDSWKNKYIIFSEMEGRMADAHYCLMKAMEYGTSDAW